MRRRWKIAGAVAATLAVLLTVNTLVVNSQTKEAGVTVDGGRILRLTGADLQITDTGEPRLAGRRPGAPIVLLHCYACSLRWWDPILPLLAERHRVVRIDLLGHGGSQKPSSGYGIDQQAGLVAEALNRLGIEGAVVVGHSLGADVATSLAERSSQLVDRVVNIDEAPDESFGSIPLLARLGYVPVLGQAMHRLTPDFAIEDGFGEVFAPDFEIESGFADPDRVVDDFRAMTYTAFEETRSAADDFVEESPIDERLGAAAVPLLVIFGSEDQAYDAEESLAAYQDVPGVRTATVEGAGHSPNVEKPGRTARLILDFAANALRRR
jgi:pimeloyl-ACP methyl ester carboxylesterase